MNFPSQNDFLIPFIQQLENGETLTREGLMTHLIAHFSLTSEQVASKSGKHSTLTNRIAWCDTHFVKAGFVEKNAHPINSLQDTFRITPLGLRQFKRDAQHITVGYLQGFYLRRVIRGAGADDSISDAERALSEAFEQLGDNWTVIQGAHWIGKEDSTVGEIDFLVAHRKYGVLVMEVKGGVITIENGKWTSTAYSGRVHPIKDPCEQAERNRRELNRWLSALPNTRGIRFALFPAVAFPDSQVKIDIRPDCTSNMMIDIRHIDNLEARLLQIFEYWHAHSDDANRQMDGQRAIEALVSVFQVTRTLQPQIYELFKREGKQIDQLTHAQYRVLRQLKLQKRVAIIGGAGTGKTLLAMEKTQQLLNEGFRVLFLCYNKNLRDWLNKRMNHNNLVVTNFHGLVGTVCNWVEAKTPTSLEEFRHHAPELLLLSAEILQKQADARLFDAIIVDEAQDFEDMWWVGINEMQKDPQHGILYIFFDDNQRIYTQMSNIPMGSFQFLLSDNCRNTQHIYRRMLAYATVTNEMDCLGPEGRPIEIRPTTNEAEANKELGRVLHELIHEQGVQPQDIIILTPASKERSQWKDLLRLGNHALTWNLNSQVAPWIRVSTIHSYKGLESPVVILTELDKLRQEELHNALIYIGMSRAKNHVIVIGNLPNPTGTTT